VSATCAYPKPLLDADVDLSGILATRAVLHDHREERGDTEPEVRARLEAMLVDEVMVLARTDEERVAVREAPRPGTWFGDAGADGRRLSQHDTDILVRCEIWMAHSASKIFDVGEFDSVPANRNIRLALGTCGPRIYGERYALKQRGGIDSDPLVRLVAWRAWVSGIAIGVTYNTIRMGTSLACSPVVACGHIRRDIAKATCCARIFKDEKRPSGLLPLSRVTRCL